MSELNLDFYRRRAKELLKLAHAGDRDALARFRVHHPDRKAPFDGAARIALHHAQRIIARENHFSSWPRLKAFVDELDRTRKQSPPDRLQSIIREKNLESLADFIRDTPDAVRLHIEPTGTTGLHEAAAGNWRAGAELLIKSGADINAIATNHPATPLILAIGFGNSSMGIWLLEQGADAWIAVTPEKSAMRTAANANDKAMISALVACGIRPDIFAAIVFQDHSVVRKIVGDDRSVLTQRTRPHEAVTFSPLHLAASHDLADIIDLLIELGADANAVDEQKRSAIDLALNMGQMEAYDRLHRHGCRPNPALLEMVGTSERAKIIARLHASLVAGNKEIVVEAIDSDPTLINQRLPDVWGSGGTFGAAPLHWAAMFGHIDIARFLLDRGADLELEDLTYCGSPLGWAMEYRRREMVAFLKAHGAREG